MHFKMYFLSSFFVVFFFFSSSIWMFQSCYHQQDQIKSTMDETTNNRTNIVSHSEETAAETRRLIFKTIFNATNTRNSGEWKLPLPSIWQTFCCFKYYSRYRTCRKISQQAKMEYFFANILHRFNLTEFVAT